MFNDVEPGKSPWSVGFCDQLQLDDVLFDRENDDSLRCCSEAKRESRCDHVTRTENVENVAKETRKKSQKFRRTEQSR